MSDVIQLNSPGAAFGNTVQTVTEDKRKRDLEMQAQAYQKSRDAKTDENADRSFGLAQQAAADQHLNVTSEIEDRAKRLALDTEKAAFEEKMQPLLLEAARLDLKQKQGEIVSQGDRHKVDQAQLALTQFEFSLQKKYGAQTAKAAADEAAARVGLTRAQTIEAQGQAGVQQSEIGRNQAETYRIMHPLAPKPTAFERQAAQAEALSNAIAALSPKGADFYDMLSNTNNPPTRAQAMLALHAAQRGGGLTPTDTQALEAIITSKDQTFITSTTENANRNRDVTAGRVDARRAVTDARTGAATGLRNGERNFTDTVAKHPAWKQLPPAVQQLIRKGMVDDGMTVPQLIDEVKNAPPDKLDQGVRDQILSVLSGG